MEEATDGETNDEFEATVVEGGKRADEFVKNVAEDAEAIEDAIYVEATGQTARVGDFVR
jgi:hypothetical protein